MDSLIEEFPKVDEEGRRYWSNKFNDDFRVYLSNYRLIRSLKGNWERFWESDIESGEINLSDVPFPDATKIQYGCYSMFTDTPPDLTYTYNEGYKEKGEPPYIRDNDGDYYVYETPIEKNSTWLDIILASDELIERVDDWQHSSVNPHHLCDWGESPETTIEFHMSS